MKVRATASEAADRDLPSSSKIHSSGLPQTGPPPIRALPFCLIGLSGGTLAGLLGIGGGLVISPLLLLLGLLRPGQVAGTTLATVLVTSVVGSGAYATLGHLNLGVAWPIAIGSVFGCVLGSLAAKRLSTRTMSILFLLVLPYFGIKEFWPSFVGPVLSANMVALPILGFATGLLSGLLGIGGASLVVPSLVGFFLFEHHAAQGIAMSVALIDSLAGVTTHARERNINYRALLYLAAPGCVATMAAAFVSHSLSGPVLHNLFALFVLIVWSAMLVHLIRSFTRKQSIAATLRSFNPRKLGSSGRFVAGAADQAGVWVPERLVTTVRLFFGRGHLMNIMLLCIPLAIVGHLYDFGPIFVFSCSALACVPLSFRLGQATESLGTRLGPVSGGLLNATFGNAAELIISVAALSHGLLVVVRTSLIGSILGQLLLVLGTSLLVAGIKYKNLGFSRALAQTNFTLMAIALVAIGLPSLFLHSGSEGLEASANFLSPILCTLLLLMYGCSVVFALRRQPQQEDDGEVARWKTGVSLLILGASTGGMILISELLVDSILPFVETTGISQVFIGLILIPIFSNVVDHIVAISVALKNKMDLSLTISVGSAAQIACMVLPAVMLIGMMMGQPLGLMFTPVELISLAVGLLLMIPVLLDGESNWLEGAQLLTCYLVLAVVLFSLQ